MNKEIIKTIVLTILVLSSVFLTWSIWTYSPNIEPISNKLVPEVAISNKKSVSDIIKPSLIVFHDDGEKHGSTDDNTIDLVLKPMSSWTFYEFKKVQPFKYESFKNKSGITELVFSDSIPFSLYKKEVIIVEDRESPTDWEFDRIFFGPGSDEDDGNEVYFVSTEKKSMYKFRVNAANIKNVTRTMRDKSETMTHYTVISPIEGRTIYVPENSRKDDKYKYIVRQLNVNKFKNALFPDPSVVKSDKTLMGREYTDGSTIMHVNEEIMTIDYVNPGLSRVYPEEKTNLLENSINFINEHSGWEDNYRYAGMNREKQSTTFRLYVEGMPVFNRQGMSELVQDWNDNDLYEYKRPYFSLELRLAKTDTIDLLSGKEIYQRLKAMPDYDPEKLENMSIGYEMNKDLSELQSSVITLEPAWFYKYNGEWIRFTEEQTGGVVRGLE